MKAIDTWYKGRFFRSRLEARWAIFFDVLGIKWDYELEGYDLDGLRYLPDFWLPQVKMWAEVKPQELNDTEKEKARRLVEFTGYPVLMLVGSPDFINYLAIELDPWGTDKTSRNAIVGWDYSLVSRYLESEHRFPCANYIPNGLPDGWPEDYRLAVIAANSERFNSLTRTYQSANA